MSRRNGEDQRRIRYRMPPVEICETSDAVVLQAELPGIEKEDIEISIEGDELYIKGKRKPHDPALRVLHGESDQADYFRVFSLGEELDSSNVGAGLNNGVLTLTLHKKPEVLPRKISVEVE